MAKNTPEATNNPEQQPETKAPKRKPAVKKAIGKESAATETRKPVARRARAPRTGTSSKTKTVAEQAGSAAAITALAAQDDTASQTAPASADTGRKTVTRKKTPSAVQQDQPIRENETSVAPAPQPSSSEQQESRETTIPLQSQTNDHESSPDNSEWQRAVITEPPGGETFQQGKRKRRRNKRGNTPNEQRQNQQNQDMGSIRDIDPKKLNKKAWTLFAAEVAEEGIALMDDNTSREAAKRAFRIAEIFLMEQGRRQQHARPRTADGESHKTDQHQ